MHNSAILCCTVAPSVVVKQHVHSKLQIHLWNSLLISYFYFFSPLKRWYPVLVGLQIIRSQTFQMLIITHLKDYDKLLLLNADFKYLEVSLYKPASFSYFVLISSGPEKYWVSATVLHMLDPVSALPCDVPATSLCFLPRLCWERLHPPKILSWISG